MSGSNLSQKGQWGFLAKLLAIIICLVSSIGFIAAVWSTHNLLFIAGAAGAAIIALLQIEFIHSWFTDHVIPSLNRLDPYAGKIINSAKWGVLKVWKLRTILLIFIVLGFVIKDYTPNLMAIVTPQLSTATSPSPCANKGICVTMIDDQSIGISDGNYSFWKDSDTNNAEKLIYQENDKIGVNKYVTVVVLTTLSEKGTEAGIGHDNLQAVYTLQHELNSGCPLPNCYKLRVLVANGGDDEQYSDIIAKQIVTLIKKNKEPIIGVLGVPLSTPGVTTGIQILSNSNIPMISSTASSDALTAASSYFFRVVPPDSQQGVVAAQYATSFIKPKKTAIFYADNNLYSKTLATSFGNALRKSSTVFYKQYKRISNSTDKNVEYRQIGINLKNALYENPDLIFCACYVDDLNQLVSDLRNSQSIPQSPIEIMGGDAAYNINSYPSHSNYQNIIFTAFAFPDEWNPMDTSLGCRNDIDNIVQDFACDYANNFDPNRNHNGVYGFTRTDNNVMVTYDSARVLLLAYTAAVHKANNSMPNGDDIQQALLGNAGCDGFLGVSGRIIFGPDGNPIDKNVAVLTVDSNGKTHGPVSQYPKAQPTDCSFR